VAAGAGGLCLHTIILDPKNPGRIYMPFGRGGPSRTTMVQDLAAHQQGTSIPIHPRPECGDRPLRSPRRHAPLAPNVLFMQKHWDVMRQRQTLATPGKRLAALPTDLLRDRRTPEPETIYVVPIKSDGEHSGRMAAGACTSRRGQGGRPEIPRI